MKKIFMFSIVLTELLLGSKVFAADIVSGQDIYNNGAKTEMSAINYNDNNYVKLRDIAKALNIGITYDAETNTVSINTDKPYIEEKPKSTRIDGNSGETIEAMKSVTATMFGYYNFTFGYEPTIRNLYEYLGYRICKVQIHKYFEPAKEMTI